MLRYYFLYILFYIVLDHAFCLSLQYLSVQGHYTFFHWVETFIVVIILCCLCCKHACAPVFVYSVMEIPFSFFELFFIVLAFTVFCVFGLAAIYKRSQHAGNQGTWVSTLHIHRSLYVHTYSVTQWFFCMCLLIICFCACMSISGEIIWTEQNGTHHKSRVKRKQEFQPSRK